MLFEDEEDIFSGGSPKKKFFDIVYNANRNLVELELDRMVERMCLLEMMLEEQMGEEAMEREIQTRTFSQSAELDECKTSKYIELTANILTQNE
ncbi:DUF2018 family protein [Hydrogenimonas cancrithermarum]|uniref:DUF2018 domain-containing protein n=1 Tax=Hydrogenimonas cancrithermarum TaxID=2993563 RepID=A0ABN6WTV5_9BACT|nr:DUF2018 family protein [Hydrogenimonas cancrithermarum]BDY12105.1 hypothetical protein HCR_04170 [Hydrogenimonas cancrithermarum]